MPTDAPIYIVSRSRWQFDRRLTTRVLDEMHVPYRVVAEADEADQYAQAVGRERVLVLDPDYQRTYETCDDLGASKSIGSGPARNFAWDHARAAGADWHWVVDDNIRGFYRLCRNLKVPLLDRTLFRVMETFCDRYANVAVAGPNYEFFAKHRQLLPPFVMNTRIYSCCLIRNDLPFRWRGRFNEDTILSLDVLKEGWCTVQFNAFLQHKLRTQSMPGGNTETYIREGTLEKSRLLARVHPDVARVVWKFGRWHHQVDYRPFRQNRLIRRADVEIPSGVDNFGLRLVSRAAAAV